MAMARMLRQSRTGPSLKGHAKFETDIDVKEKT